MARRVVLARGVRGAGRVARQPPCNAIVAEPIVTRISALQDWTVYLPGPSASALTRITLTDQDFLEPWQGGAVLVVYGLLVAAAGLWRTTRVDLT